LSGKVICISRQLAAGGEEVGRLVAQQLGFRYADGEIIVAAAEKAGVSPDTIAAAERPPGLIGRILESLGRTPVAYEGSAVPAEAHLMSPGYERLIEDVIREAAQEGNVVIVAHGASIPLAEAPGVLRVFVTASPNVRIERLVGEAGLDEAGARKAVEESDRQRREFLARFYQLREELPTHYDMVLNTDRMSPAAAAGLVVQAATTK
jgi:cytidylate kinase